MLCLLVLVGVHCESFESYSYNSKLYAYDRVTLETFIWRCACLIFSGYLMHTC